MPDKGKMAVNRRETDGNALYSITELAREFGISTRTIRFYESRGLITPERSGSTRVFSHHDRARLILILRGKRLGFSLREIRDYLDLYDTDPVQPAATAHLDRRLDERIGLLEQQQMDVETTLDELKDIKKRTEAALRRA